MTWGVWGLAGDLNQGDMVGNWRSGLGNLKSFLEAGCGVKSIDRDHHIIFSWGCLHVNIKGAMGKRP